MGIPYSGSYLTCQPCSTVCPTGQGLSSACNTTSDRTCRSVQVCLSVVRLVSSLSVWLCLIAPARVALGIMVAQFFHSDSSSLTLALWCYRIVSHMQTLQHNSTPFVCAFPLVFDVACLLSALQEWVSMVLSALPPTTAFAGIYSNVSGFLFD